MIPSWASRRANSNRLAQTNDFTVAPWAAAVTGTSTRANEARADLACTAGVITATSALGGLRQSVTGLVAGQNYVWSFYVESVATSLALVLENGTASYGTSCNVTINPSTGGIGVVTGFLGVTSRAQLGGWNYNIVLPPAAGTLIANLEWRITTSGDVVRIGRPSFG